MSNLVQTNEINWKDYKTEFLTGKTLKNFLMSETIPCLSCRFKTPEDFYESIIFKLPGGKEHKDYKMIYSHLVQFYPHDYLEKNELAKKHNIKEEDIIAEGSVKLMDTSLEQDPLVRWMIIKA
ncbi:MAG: hypothetical protein PF542_05850 [Nanoarchaeota archaeon]|jgi:hypothetical protein|nr:hypothetical protein [Nanoarchaeota archaeon]